MIETWSRNSYALDDVAASLRKLERPNPGRPGHHISGLNGFMDQQSYDLFGELEYEHRDLSVSGSDSTYVSQSLFLHPDSVDDEVLDQALLVHEDLDIVFVASDVSEDCILEEDEAIAILATYGQVRMYLHQKKDGSRFSPTAGPSGTEQGIIRAEI